MACLGARFWMGVIFVVLRDALANGFQDADVDHGSHFDSIKGAFQSLDPDSNKSYEEQAQEAIAELVNSVKKSPPQEVKEESKSFLEKGQTCKRQCKKEMKRHLGNTCEYLEEQVKNAKKVDHAHLIDSTENALKICKQSEQHHSEYCKWRCWREEL
mmetsp:Transcript_32426/g.57510  ORF Transcript_32426/g.57510 Transcript_32426/m.57510 type:complete len:157 (-) Transcript_32426:67-537(-)